MPFCGKPKGQPVFPASKTFALSAKSCVNNFAYINSDGVEKHVLLFFPLTKELYSLKLALKTEPCVMRFALFVCVLNAGVFLACVLPALYEKSSPLT